MLFFRSRGSISWSWHGGERHLLVTTSQSFNQHGEHPIGRRSARALREGARAVTPSHFHSLPHTLTPSLTLSLTPSLSDALLHTLIHSLPLSLPPSHSHLLTPSHTRPVTEGDAHSTGRGLAGRGGGGRVEGRGQLFCRFCEFLLDAGRCKNRSVRAVERF